ncbi:hypothetical protein HII12_005332 [Brettanomyces bruxellensis]|uniref:mRNA stability protein n=1 Tax=Dekkera bruxellensis TaxID=5007 RepID=A0A8H6B6F6_DEKBR|nr:hypothetical protein HII12_005332 [Brettanomyces bruxellensis]
MSSNSGATDKANESASKLKGGLPDLSKLSAEELKLYKMYGKLPKTTDVLQDRLKDRKFFDSGDYALSKVSGGKKILQPEIENLARINRNSFSGSGAPSLLGSNQRKSKLEEDLTDSVLEDD